MNNEIILVLFTSCVLSFSQDTLVQWEPAINITQDTIYNLYPWLECQGEYVHIVWAELDKGVYYQRSTDSGTTWSSSFRLHTDTTAVLFPKLALGNEKVYCVWNAWYAGNWCVRFSSSTDYGLSWDSVITLDTGVCNKTMIATSGDTVFIVEHMLDTTFRLRRSYDGGVNWSLPYIISRLPPLYYPGLLFEDHVVHLAYTNYDTLFYMNSTDLGETWSIPFHITSPPNADAVKCRNIVSNNSGFLFVPWEDNRYSGGTLDDVILRRSTDSGITWLPEQQITNHHLTDHWDDICCADSDVYMVWPKGGADASLQFSASTDMGETWCLLEDLCNNLLFDGTVTTDLDKIHVAWRDRRELPSEIYYRQGTRLPVGIYKEIGNSITGNSLAAPNPFTERVRFVVLNPSDKTIVQIYDIVGKKVMRISATGKSYIQWDGRNLYGQLLPTGIYFCEIINRKQTDIVTVIKIK